MYAIDRDDRVEELKTLPQQSIGAPLPVVLADDGGMVLAYLLEFEDDKVAIVEFDYVTAHYFGPPNDEALSGHPLHPRGLGGYGAYEVHNSSWVRALERMNRVHPNHRPTMYSGLRHFIFTFHDTLFECIAKSIRHFDLVPYIDGASLVGEMKRRLDRTP
jgi:hypothetical protein